MSELGDFLRGEFRIGKKFPLAIIDGDSSPTEHHEDGWTSWKNRKPVRYHRAVNEMRVGRGWLRKWFPLMLARAKLDGSNHLQLEQSDIDYYRRLKEHARLVEDGKVTNLCAWRAQEARKSVRTLDEEGDLLYA